MFQFTLKRHELKQFICFFLKLTSNRVSRLTGDACIISQSNHAVSVTCKPNIECPISSYTGLAHGRKGAI